MEKPAPEQSPERVIAWLRSPSAERWSMARISFTGRIHGHSPLDGVFASVFDGSPEGWSPALARWMPGMDGGLEL